MIESKQSMVSRNSNHNPEVKKQLKEIKKLQKELEQKKKDYEKKVAKDKEKTLKVRAAKEAQVTKEKLRRRKELSRKIEAKLKEEAKERKLQEKKAIKESLIQEKARLKEAQEKARLAEAHKKQKEAEEIKKAKLLEAERKHILAEQAKQERYEQRLANKEARRLKVIAAKESRYKKMIAGKDFLKGKIKNLKVYAKKAAIVGLLAGSIVLVYKSNIIPNTIADLKQKKLMEQSIEDNKEPEIEITVQPVEPIEEKVEEEEIEIEVEQPHEVVSTDLYDEGFEFDETVTPEMLNAINPLLSDNTCWICIPGTNINYPVVHPSINNIDQVEGLRSDIEKSDLDDDVYMNQYYLHKNLTGDKSSDGTVFLDIYNNTLNRPSDELSDMNVMYGHKMKSGSMFSDLHKWKYDATGTYNAEHPYGIIYTNDGYGYKVTFITSRLISGESNSILHLNNFESYEEKCEYIQSIMDEAKENGWFTLDDYSVEEDDKFLSLIACSYEADNMRYQLIGVLDKIKVRDTNLAYNENGYYVEESSTLHR